MKKSYNTKLKIPLDKILFNIILTGFIAVGFSAFTPKAEASEINVSNVLKDINDERVSHNLKPLYLNTNLDQAANLKSKDMINRDYFEHYAFGLTPWDFIKIQGYDFSVAGENLAMDFATSEGMVKAWMDSPDHRQNILNPRYEDIGIGVVKGTFTDGSDSHETIMVTNLFAKKKSKISIYLDTLLKNYINW